MYCIIYIYKDAFIIPRWLPVELATTNLANCTVIRVQNELPSVWTLIQWSVSQGQILHIGWVHFEALTADTGCSQPMTVYIDYIYSHCSQHTHYSCYGGIVKFHHIYIVLILLILKPYHFKQVLKTATFFFLECSYGTMKILSREFVYHRNLCSCPSLAYSHLNYSIVS